MREVCERSTEVILDILNDGEVALNRSSLWKYGGQAAVEVSQNGNATASVRTAVLESHGTIALIQRLLKCLLGLMSNDKLFKLLLNKVYL